MIDIHEARRRIMAAVRPMPFAPLALDLAQDHHLAADALARDAHPRFDMSAVDGYAVAGDGPTWTLKGALAAGEVHAASLQPGECVRIFTGAQVPGGADRIVMQERTAQADGRVRLSDSVPAVGANIRRRGEQFTEGELLLRQGERLDAPAIGLLASAGLEEVEASFKPWVSVVRTGGEFIEQGGDRTGRIHSSNEWMLFAALHKELCEVEEQGAFIARDDDQDIANALQQAIEADVVITTGGVSVGDHDRVADVLRSMGADIRFHGVAQKPGKPMLFALLKGKPVFALPGNPRAVMVLFWEYVLPFLRAMQGDPEPGPRVDRLPLAAAVRCKGDRTEFRAVRIAGGLAHPLSDEGSHMLRSLTAADGLMVLNPGDRELRPGELVDVHLRP